SATTWAYQLSGTPGGSEPDSTTHEAVSALASTDIVSALSAAASSVAPGSLSFVVVPSCSVMARLVRTAPVVGTQLNDTALAERAATSGSPVGAGSTATASRPASVSARATLTPLPPGSVVTDETRCTAPRVSDPLSATVRSMLGLGVTVTIMRPAPRRRSPSTG